MPQYEELGVKRVVPIHVYIDPLKVSVTQSITASGTGTTTITIPTDKRYWVKKVNITKGADITVEADGVKFDGKSTKEIATFDTETVFGILLPADTTITVAGTNAGLAAQDLTIEIIGYEVDREVLDK